MFSGTERLWSMTKLLALSALLVATTLAHAEPLETTAASPAKTHLDIETSPISFTFMRGAELGVGVRLPGAASHWRLRGFIDYEHIPQTFVDMDERNTGWKVHDTFGSLVGDYFLHPTGGGLHFNASFAVSRVTLTAPMSGASTNATQVGTRLGVSYQWFPFKSNGFYVEPWLFVLAFPFHGTDMVGAETYHEPSVVPAGQLQVGYEL